MCILAVVYHEPEWIQTCVSIAEHCSGIPIVFVDRKGFGSLAEAVNRGIRDNCIPTSYVWVLTNVVFGPQCLQQLMAEIQAQDDLVAVSPAFNSDHAFMRPIPGPRRLVEVPFVEFTCPLVQTQYLRDVPLDERMPYAGHDIDWGYQMRERGRKLAVLQNVIVGHVYIRDTVFQKPNPITRKRHRLRVLAEESTKAYLHAKHGPEWRQKLQCNY